MTNEPMQWPDDVNCAITVCDAEGVILFMNRKARETFAAHGNLIGKNLFECHSEESRAKIRQMLASGESNAYTISKNGLKKVIYQTPWRRDGKVAGMVEISMVVPEEMPHHIR
ncbi:MAG: PAS domain-containing protein [Muribaculaceae bacterium]|nr:PAS domain-containing protein [Muribaculaceae bacterium]